MVKIGFSTHRKNLISSLVRKMTKSKVSHCFFIVDDPVLGGQIVLQADFGGWEPWSIESFVAKGNEIVAIVDTVQPIDAAISVWARKMGRVGYDYLGLFATLVVVVGRWFRRKWHNPIHSNKSLFCSEAIVEVLQSINYPGTADLVPWDTTPQDLLDLLHK